jgi:HTH-type transcriptional regulator / antitoxin HigA
MTKILKSKADYEAALAEIERLIDLDPQAKTPEAEQLELLALLVGNYEAKTFPKIAPDPIDAIMFQMEQHNLTPRSLIPYIGSRSKVSEVLSRKRPLTISMIRALHEGLGIPASVLIQKSTAEEHDPEQSEEPDWSRFPIREMAARGWVENSLQSVKSFFTRLPSPVQSAILLRKTKHIRSARGMDTYALTAWVARIVTIANERSDFGKYHKGSVNLSFMQEVARCSALNNGPVIVRDFLAKRGIPLIIEPHLSSTYLDGAAILIYSERPIIGMTLRHDRVDNFWFTLMHELAHVSLHSGQENTEFIDDLDVESREDPKEKEADVLAGEALIPRAIWVSSAASRVPSPEAALSLSRKLQINPAIVAGKMRHERKAFRLLNNLIGHREVRKQFPTIKWLD